MYAIRKYDFGTREKKTTHLYPIYHLLQVKILSLDMIYLLINKKGSSTSPLM